jgi:hypothetical protein
MLWLGQKAYQSASVVSNQISGDLLIIIQLALGGLVCSRNSCNTQYRVNLTQRHGELAFTLRLRSSTGLVR